MLPPTLATRADAPGLHRAPVLSSITVSRGRSRNGPRRITTVGFAEGEAVDRFVLVQQLGQGGQGAVWKAEDRLSSGRLVALKLVDAGAASSTHLERMRREAHALAKLNHPSLVACHGLFEDLRKQVLGLAMDLVDGCSLETALEDPRLTPDRRHLVLRHVAAALAYLHERRIVHRDLKPENILLAGEFFERPDDPNSVKVVDFGIVAAGGGEKPLTELGHVIGTPGYIAPELLEPARWGLRGSTPAADVFGFGVVAWKVLVGGHPTGLPDSSTLNEFAAAYRSAPSGGPSWPHAVGPTAVVFERCLVPDPNVRPQDGRELLAYLDHPETMSATVTSSLSGSTVGDTEVDRPPTRPEAPSAPLRGEIAAQQAAATHNPRPLAIQPEGARSGGACLIIVIGLGLVVSSVVALAVIWSIRTPVQMAVPGEPPSKSASVQAPVPAAGADGPRATPLAPKRPSEAKPSRLASSDRACDVACSSHYDCGDDCDGGVRLGEVFHLRVSGAAKKGSPKPVDLKDSVPEAVVCVRVVSSGARECFSISNDRPASEKKKFVEVKGSDLLMHGLDIEVKDGSRTLGVRRRAHHSDGLKRGALCKGTVFGGFPEDSSVAWVGAFLDPPREQVCRP